MAAQQLQDYEGSFKQSENNDDSDGEDDYPPFRMGTQSIIGARKALPRGSAFNLMYYKYHSYS